ncbi:MAG: hypothetical protein PHV06_03395 [bacterium]|nr:hypothetical protein [bacterium]
MRKNYSMWLIIFCFLLMLSPLSVWGELEDDDQEEDNDVDTILSELDELPVYLHDRGTGIQLSMFGSYINKGQFFFYPFFEYYLDENAEYSPVELGFSDGKDYRGKYYGTEYLVFFGYGISDWIAVEMEVAYIDASQEKAEDDPDIEMPEKFSESGIGDVEGQMRWRFNKETESRPEYFGYFETVFPVAKQKKLIGTQDWEFKLGFGVLKGFRFGTMAFRLSTEYDRSEDKYESGEFALEYVKVLSDHWRTYLGIEGAEDEIEFITEFQWHINDKVYIKINHALGITSKAEDFAPEYGILFIF